MYNNDLSILVLTCDKYADLWDDFFNLRDLYWNSNPFRWYLVTESKEYVRNNVFTIKCGNFSWSNRFRIAINQLNTKFVGVFLDDYFISDFVDTNRILEFLDVMKLNNVDYLNVGDVFGNIINLKSKSFFSERLIYIPKHKKYGISMSAAIWERKFLLSKIGEGNYSAWEFEIDRCKEAKSEIGLEGLLLCDMDSSFNVTKIPVVIQGKFYPKAIKEFAIKGYCISTKGREIMSVLDVFIYNLKLKFSKCKYFRKTLKWIGEFVFKIKFFTDD